MKFYYFLFRNYVSFITSLIVRLPVPLNISYFWNFSSCLGLLLICQVLTSFFLSCFMYNYSSVMFTNLAMFMNDSNLGWLFRLSHAVSSSFIMFFLYLHLSRGLYYKRFYNLKAWTVGVILMIMTMLVAFLSYVLPWSQMSYWSATVITNLVSTMPFGSLIVNWLWSSFVVSNYTLNRFYSLHFLVPFLLLMVALVHLIFIHDLGSSNSLGHFSSLKLDFWAFFSVKDIFSFFVMFSIFFFFLFFKPYMFFDTENFIEANNMVTPTHIKPEWYFLFAYAMLRCIPNKLLSVLVLVLSIMVFFLFPFSSSKITFNYLQTLIFTTWVFNFIFLTWLSGCPVKEMYTYMSQIFSIFYFFLFIFFF